jgi:hypothetical protein
VGAKNGDALHTAVRQQKCDAVFDACRSVKELGIPVILTTLPCNGLAFEPKNKKNNF